MSESETPLSRAALDAVLARYLDQASWPEAAAADLTPEQIRAKPIPGTWSIGEILLHLADADVMGSTRIKRVIAEDEPTYAAYDQDRFVERLGYATASIPLAVQLFRAVRLQTHEILSRLSVEDFARRGRHEQDGWERLDRLVAKYVDHVNHHMLFLRDKRARVGAGAEFEVSP